MQAARLSLHVLVLMGVSFASYMEAEMAEAGEQNFKIASWPQLVLAELGKAQRLQSDSAPEKDCKRCLRL